MYRKAGTRKRNKPLRQIAKPKGAYYTLSHHTRGRKSRQTSNEQTKKSGKKKNDNQAFKRKRRSVPSPKKDPAKDKIKI